MITKLKQIWRDHQAMQRMRANNGDVYLVCYVSPMGIGFECYVNQIDDPSVIDGNTPEEAILDAFRRYDAGLMARNSSIVLKQV